VHAIVSALLNEFPLTAVVYFFGKIIQDISTVVVIIITGLLRLTVLKPDAFNGFWWTLLNNGYLVMAGLAAAIALASLVWEALQIQQRTVLSVGPDDSYAALLGRSIWAILMIAAGPIFLHILIALNNVLVQTFDQWFMHALLASLQLGKLVDAAGKIFHIGTASFGISQKELVNDVGSSMATLAEGTLTYIFLEFTLLLVAILLLWAVLMFFTRQFELIFWGAIMPVALALSIADPRQQLWQFTKRQLQGLIFQQAIMAFVIWLTISVRVDILAGQSDYGIFRPLMGNIFTAIGFYYAFQMPKYWQQANGHTSGGNEIAQIAAGSMLGRLGTGAIMSGMGGQWMKNLGNNLTEQSQARISRLAEKDSPTEQMGGAMKPVKDWVQRSAAGPRVAAVQQRFHDWMDRGTHDPDDLDYWEGGDTEDMPAHAPPSAGHQAAARAVRGGYRAARFSTNLAFAPLGTFSRHTHQLETGAALLHEANRTDRLDRDQASGLPAARLQNDAQEAQNHLAALQADPDSARAIDADRRYQPPDAPDGIAPPTNPDGSPRGPGPQARPSQSTTRAFTQTPSGLYVPQTPVPSGGSGSATGGSSSAAPGGSSGGSSGGAGLVGGGPLASDGPIPADALPDWRPDATPDADVEVVPPPPGSSDPVDTTGLLKFAHERMIITEDGQFPTQEQYQQHMVARSRVSAAATRTALDTGADQYTGYRAAAQADAAPDPLDASTMAGVLARPDDGWRMDDAPPPLGPDLAPERDDQAGIDPRGADYVTDDHYDPESDYDADYDADDDADGR
jgi:uncharacterized membrane protein YgcG